MEQSTTTPTLPACLSVIIALEIYHKQSYKKQNIRNNITKDKSCYNLSRPNVARTHSRVKYCNNTMLCRVYFQETTISTIRIYFVNNVSCISVYVCKDHVVALLYVYMICYYIFGGNVTYYL